MPGVEHPELPVVPARRVRHRQARGHDLAARHVEHRAGRRPCCSRQPPAVSVWAMHGDERGRPVAHRQPVEVAAVLAGELRDERRPPPRHEAVRRVEADQAGEQRVDDPQVGLAGGIGAPRHLVALDAAGDGRAAGQEAPVVPTGRLELRGELGVVVAGTRPGPWPRPRSGPRRPRCPWPGRSGGSRSRAALVARRPRPAARPGRSRPAASTARPRISGNEALCVKPASRTDRAGVSGSAVSCGVVTS